MDSNYKLIKFTVLVLVLFLSGCVASGNKRDTHAYGDLDRDGCIAYRCKVYCRDDATKEQVKAFNVGGIDAGEQVQLDRLKLWTVGDTATTIGALALCEGVRELNPVLGSSPGPIAVALYNGVTYAYAYQSAKRTPEWCSSERPLRVMVDIRKAVTISNAAVLVLCQ